MNQHEKHCDENGKPNSYFEIGVELHELDYLVKSQQPNKLEQTKYLQINVVIILTKSRVQIQRITSKKFIDQLIWDGSQQIYGESSLDIPQRYLSQMKHFLAGLFVDERGQKVEENICKKYHVNDVFYVVQNNKLLI